MLTANIANHYRIPAKRVNGHCDLVATRCPGTYMRGKIDQIKKDLA
jgi:N-acetyl-anhydromuramyl-L-alanine amidase AmpD